MARLIDDEWIRWADKLAKHMCRSYGVTRWHEQDDVRQDAMLRLLEREPQFRSGPGAWRGFTITVLRRTVINFIRTRAGRGKKPHLQVINETDLPPTKKPSPIGLSQSSILDGLVRIPVPMRNWRLGAWGRDEARRISMR